MATQSLNSTINLDTTSTVTGIFKLNTQISQILKYDDTNVSSSTMSATTGTNVLIASSVAKVTYVYIENTDSTNFLVLKNDAGNIWGRVEAGKWAFFPVAPSVGLEVSADTAAVTINYALFQGL